jgi:hypothetical protein
MPLFWTGCLPRLTAWVSIPKALSEIGQLVAIRNGGAKKNRKNSPAGRKIRLVPLGHHLFSVDNAP